jgi:hypothetical protein
MQDDPYCTVSKTRCLCFPTPAHHATFHIQHKSKLRNSTMLKVKNWKNITDSECKKKCRTKSPKSMRKKKESAVNYRLLRGSSTNETKTRRESVPKTKDDRKMTDWKAETNQQKTKRGKKLKGNKTRKRETKNLQKKAVLRKSKNHSTISLFLPQSQHTPVNKSIPTRFSEMELSQITLSTE